jgi:hypothetical protein
MLSKCEHEHLKVVCQDCGLEWGELVEEDEDEVRPATYPYWHETAHPTQTVTLGG